MSIFDKIFRRSEEVEPPQDNNVTTIPWMPIERVESVTSPNLAMKIATVYRCADILSKGIAQLPLEFQIDKGGYFQTDKSNPLNYLLAVRPNKRQSAYEMQRAMVLQLLFQGNAYIYPKIDAKGYSEFILLSPNSVNYDKVNNQFGVSDNVNKIFGVFDGEEIIHVKNLTLDGGYLGESIITYASKVMSISSNADDVDNKTFKNGGLVKGIVTGASQNVGFGVMLDDQVSDVADNVANQLAQGRTILSMPPESKFQQISLSPQDIELLSTKSFNVIEICRFFGVPPDKVFANQSTNYKASEMSQVAFLTDTLQPYLRQIELDYSIKLIPKSQFNSQRIRFNISDLLQTDLTTQAEYMAKTIATGVMSVNDWRKKMGQPPVEGGDATLVSANLVPITSEKLWR